MRWFVLLRNINNNLINTAMNKKYQVMKRLGANWNPSYENEFNNLDDARLFRNLLQKTENENESSSKWEYYIVEVIE